MTAVTNVVARERPKTGPIQSIPLVRITSVELRKMFDTRSGFWLMASIAITSVLATIAVIIFAPDEEVKYTTFAAAFGFPMSVILPIIAILSVTSEWSQRSGLTTFTLVPHRGRIVLAKGLATLVVAVASMALAMVIGVIGNVIGAAITGVDLTWDASVVDLLYIVFGNALGMLIGFMLGLLIRNSPGAIVAYFVFSLVLPTLFSVLDEATKWFSDVRPWVDFNFAQGALFSGDPLSGEQWANLAVTTFIWLVIPMAVGIRLVLRSEIK
jgi:ABC-2 type transport system permease protein